MADWVVCKAAGPDGKQILINLEAAYMISSSDQGSLISFLVSESGPEGGEVVSHVVADKPDEIMKKLRSRPSA